MTAEVPDEGQPDVLQFHDNSLLPLLYGEHDQNLARIERQLGVSVASRGNRLAISGPADGVRSANIALQVLYERLEKGLAVDDGEIDAAVRMAQSTPDTAAKADAVTAVNADHLAIRTRKRHITPRSPGQAAYMEALASHELVFGLGPAGTGKTYLAVAMAVSLLMNGEVDRIIVSRPAVEAGERLGFLPGDLREKVDPYLRPLYDALYEMLPAEQVVNRLSNGEIEVAPLAFMRGRTLSNAFIILDEAQNTTPVQMKMFLTRFGENSRMAVTGDLSQVDLPKGQPSGLQDAVDLLSGIEEVAFVEFTDADVVRHSLVTRIVRAYEAHENAEKRGAGAAVRRPALRPRKPVVPPPAAAVAPAADAAPAPLAGPTEVEPSAAAPVEPSAAPAAKAIKPSEAAPPAGPRKTAKAKRRKGTKAKGRKSAKAGASDHSKAVANTGKTKAGRRGRKAT